MPSLEPPHRPHYHSTGRTVDPRRGPGRQELRGRCGRLHPGHRGRFPDGLLPPVKPTRNLVRRSNRRIGGRACRELTGVDFTGAEQAMACRGSGAAEDCTRRIHDGAAEIARGLREPDAAGERFRRPR